MCGQGTPAPQRSLAALVGSECSLEQPSDCCVLYQGTGLGLSGWDQGGGLKLPPSPATSGPPVSTQLRARARFVTVFLQTCKMGIPRKGEAMGTLINEGPSPHSAALPWPKWMNRAEASEIFESAVG